MGSGGPAASAGAGGGGSAAGPAEEQPAVRRLLPGRAGGLPDGDCAGRAPLVLDARVGPLDQVARETARVVVAHRLAGDDDVLVLLGDGAGVAAVAVFPAGFLDRVAEGGADVGAVAVGLERGG